MGVNPDKQTRLNVIQRSRKAIWLVLSYVYEVQGFIRLKELVNFINQAIFIQEANVTICVFSEGS